VEASLRGRAHKYGKNVDTDVIIPGKYCNIVDPAELGKHALEGLDPDYTSRMKSGDIIVADSNFGCGSSREVAPIAIKGSGTSAVIAKSFARIFYRNALNIGLPIFESDEAVDGIESGDEIELEPATGVVRNITKGTKYQAAEFPPFMQSLIDAGGLIPHVERRLAERRSAEAANS
jgi:3-isopropylmalate/(R)-2-methylmalate dehydratase small subunit